MRRAGIETWLMNILRRMDLSRFQTDIMVHVDKPGEYDDEIRALGSRIIPCPHTSRPLLFAGELRRILDEYGPYDVVHSHIDHYSGWVLRTADTAGVPVGIAHSHIDLSYMQNRVRPGRKLYYAYTKRLIKKHATVCLAVSNKAAEWLFGPDWQRNAHVRTLYPGVDLIPFRQPVSQQTVRQELAIAANHFVLGNVGRFAIQKNHTFALDIFAEVLQREPSAHLVLVGEGELLDEIKNKAENLGVADRTVFAGSRSDVPRLMLGAMNVFLFPSLWEGLGLALVEAQAAGLPCVLSDCVPQEVDVVTPLTHRLSLSAPVGDWVNAVLASRREDKSDLPSQHEALSLVEESPFNIETARLALESLYTSLVPSASSSQTR